MEAQYIQLIELTQRMKSWEILTCFCKLLYNYNMFGYLYNKKFTP